MAYIQPQARGDLDFYRRTADNMNHAAELCGKAGLRFAYHDHAFEFAGKEGERPIDIFYDRLDKNLVALEMDVFWVSVAGNDPVEMLQDGKAAWGCCTSRTRRRAPPVQYSETPAALRIPGGGQRHVEFYGDSEGRAGSGRQALFCRAGPDSGRSTGQSGEELRLSQGRLTAVIASRRDGHRFHFFGPHKLITLHGDGNFEKVMSRRLLAAEYLPKTADADRRVAAG